MNRDHRIAGQGFVPVGNGSSGANLSYRPKGRAFAAPQTLNTDGFLDAMVAGHDNQLTIIDELRGSDGRTTLLRAFDRALSGALVGPTVIAPPGAVDPKAVVTPRGDTVVTFTLNGAQGRPGGPPPTIPYAVALVDRPAGLVFGPPLPVSPPSSAGATPAVNANGAAAIVWQATSPLGGGVVQAVVRDGPAELGFLGLGSVLNVPAGGVITLPVGCSGIKDCAGSIELQALTTVRASSSRTVVKRLVRRSIRFRRDRRGQLRLRVPSRALKRGRTRARLIVRLRGVRGPAARRVHTVVLRKR